MDSFNIGNIIELLVFIGAIVCVYVNMKVKLKEFEVRLKHVEDQDKKILDKLDDINEKLVQIQIDLNNKENR